MTVIPVSVFIFVVMVMFGGPAAFMNVVSLWLGDLTRFVGNWIRHL